MKIVVVTTGRYHVLDLARELALMGHKVIFLSLVPSWRAKKFGLPASSCKSYFFLFLPLLLLGRIVPGVLRHKIDRAIVWLADLTYALSLPESELFIGMSGIAVKSAAKARRRGSVVFIERGSRHIDSQKEILDQTSSCGGAKSFVSDYDRNRELQSYAAADMVVVPALHALESFVQRGFSRGRLICIPYGTDLSMFPPTACPSFGSPTLIYVGNWSYQKGCDFLVLAMRTLAPKFRLIHVGKFVDAPIPKDDWFMHHDAVPQWQLKSWYEKAHVFVMASRQEGLALVQVQALACGLPLACSDFSGGSDLAKLGELSKLIFTFRVGDVAGMATAIKSAYVASMDAFVEGQLRVGLGKERELLSWQEYARNYQAEILSVLEGRATRSVL